MYDNTLGRMLAIFECQLVLFYFSGCLSSCFTFIKFTKITISVVSVQTKI